MRIAFLLSSLGGSPLQVGLERGLTALGHDVMYWRPHVRADLIVVFNQVAHNPAYCYPGFPSHGEPVAFIDAAEYGWVNRVCGRENLFANTFSEGALAHDSKNRREQLRVKEFLQGRSFPYFSAEMHKTIEYPGAYHPIYYPLYMHSEDHTEPDREEYLRRDLELFCAWGASHPWRMQITDALRNAHRMCEVSIIGEAGFERMPQAQYFQRTRAAKCSVAFDGYGSGSFRMTEVLCRTLLLQGPLSVRVRAPLVDGVTCRAYDVQNDGETFLSTNVAEVMAGALADPEGSFEIYRNGFEHVHTHLSETATARYVLSVVEAHDWTKSTPLDIQ